MHKLTPEELQAMTLVRRGKQSAFSVAVLSLEVGEALFLPKKEWTRKYSPSDSVRSMARTHGRKFELLSDVQRTGWVVKRLS